MISGLQRSACSVCVNEISEDIEEQGVRKIPCGKMLLERIGLTQCQGDVFSPLVEEPTAI